MLRSLESQPSARRSDGGTGLPARPSATASLRELAHTAGNRAMASLVRGRKLQRQQVEDWNFTPADYLALSAPLRFGSDSDWLPTRFKSNILATLVYLLSTAGQRGLRLRVEGGTTSTDLPFTGVSQADLYHAHVVVQRGVMHNPALRDLQHRYIEAARRSHAVANGGRLTEERLPAFAAAVGAAQQDARTLLEAIAGTDAHGDLADPPARGAALLYHTLETNAARFRVAPGDPRRNVLTPLDSLVPTHYSPPNSADANFRGDYDEVMALSLLVDARGVIHAQPGGGMLEQSLTTGRVEGTVDRLLESFAPPPGLAPRPAAPQRPPTYGRGRARASQLVYVDSQARPTRWSYSMHPGTSTPMQAWHELGGCENFIMVGNQRFFLSSGGTVRP